MRASNGESRQNIALAMLCGALLGGVIVGTLTLARKSTHSLWHEIKNTVAVPRAVAQGEAPPIIRDKAAFALYRQSLLAQKSVVLSAQVTATQPGKPKAAPYQIALVEGPGRRYRMTYLSPPEVRGRVLVSNGKTLFQYEPARNAVIKRPLPTDPVGSIGETQADEILPDVPMEVTLSPTSESIDGRPADVLLVRVQKNGSQNLVLRSKRWVDRATRRNLRIERYDESGVLRRRISFSNIRIAPSDQALFEPKFPTSARVIPATAPQAVDAALLARHLALPSRVHGMHVYSAVALRSAPREVVTAGLDLGTMPALRSHQLLYGDGLRFISVFVSQLPPAEIDSTTLRPKPGWKTSETANETEIPFLTRADEKRGQVAVAWLKEGRRYVAVSRMPLPHLMPIVRELVATR